MKKTMKLTTMALFLVAFMVVAAYAAGGMESHSQTGQTMGQSQYPIKASDLMDKTVNTQQGEEVGTVKDVVIGQQGEIQYVVLEPSGDLEKEDQLLPVPFDTIQAESGKDALTVSLDMEKLRNAPAITQDQWENITNQDIDTQVRGYYGTEGGMMEQQPGMMEQQQQQEPPAGMPEGY